MWRNAANSLLELYKLTRSTREERSTFDDTVNRVTSRNLQRSEDSTGLGADEINLRFFLTNIARNKALEQFQIKAQAALNLAAASKDDHALEASEDYPSPTSTTSMPSMANTKSEMLMYYTSECNDISLRASLASNEGTPASILWLLVEDASSEVKLGLISNKNSPVAVIEKLCRDADRKVSRKAELKLRFMYKNEVGIAAGNLSQIQDAEDVAQKEDCNLDDLYDFFNSIAL